MSAQSAPDAATASSTVFHTGKPSWVVPPLPGVTPPTTWVPYSLQRRAWKVPSRPVMPCTSTRVERSTRMLIARPRAPAPRPSGARAHLVGGGEVEAGLGEHLPPQLHVRAFHPHDDGQLEAELLHGGDQPLRQPIAAQDAAEHVDEHRLDARVGGQDAEGALDLLGRGPAAHVEKVGGGPARELDDVHGGHGEARAVHHASDTAVELDVVEPVLRGLDVERRLLVDVAQGQDSGWRNSALSSKLSLASRARTRPSPVTTSGLTSASGRRDRDTRGRGSGSAPRRT